MAQQNFSWPSLTQQNSSPTPLTPHNSWPSNEINLAQIIQQKLITRPILRPFKNIQTKIPLKNNTLAFAKTYSINSNGMTRIGPSTLAKRVIKIEISATTISSTWTPKVLSIISNLAPLAYVKNQRSQYCTGQYSRYLSYRLVNRYRSTYVSFRFKFKPIPDLPALLEKIGCFGHKYDSGR